MTFFGAALIANNSSAAFARSLWSFSVLQEISLKVSAYPSKYSRQGLRIFKRSVLPIVAPKHKSQPIQSYEEHSTALHEILTIDLLEECCRIYCWNWFVHFEHLQCSWGFLWGALLSLEGFEVPLHHSSSLPSWRAWFCLLRLIEWDTPRWLTSSSTTLYVFACRNFLPQWLKGERLQIFGLATFMIGAVKVMLAVPSKGPCVALICVCWVMLELTAELEAGGSGLTSSSSSASVSSKPSVSAQKGSYFSSCYAC